MGKPSVGIPDIHMAECNSLSTVVTTAAISSRSTEASTVAINSLSTVVTTAAILTVMEGEQALSPQLTSLPSLTAAISNHTMVAISNLSMVYNSLTMVASMVATVVSTEEFNSHSMVDIMVDTMDLNTMADKYMGEN